MTLILILILANRRSLLGSAANGPVARWRRRTGHRLGRRRGRGLRRAHRARLVRHRLNAARPGATAAAGAVCAGPGGSGRLEGHGWVESGHPLPKTPRQKWIETKESWERSRHIELPAPIPAAPPRPGGLRVAFLIYRGNPRCGGQGVYTRHLTRELVALGHSVEVFAGPPWPDLDEGVGFTPVPGLDLYRDPDPVPRSRIRASSPSREDWIEFAIMCTAGFGEPLAYSRRARQLLAQRRGEFDVVHDNQCLGNGMLGMVEDGWPLLTTLHHPITVDRQLALSHTTNPWQTLHQRRWFGFLRMQVRVARTLPAVVTVSENSRKDIAAQMGVPPERMTVVPVGVDQTVFRPREDVTPRSGRIMVTSSSDVPMKGLVPLLEAVAKLRTERDVEADRHRASHRGRPGRPGHRPVGSGRRRALRERHQRRRAGAAVRRGRGGGRALALRGFLAAGDRGHVLRRGGGRHHRRRLARGRGHATARPVFWCRPMTPARWPVRSPGCSTTPALRARLGAAGASEWCAASRGRSRRRARPSCYQAMLERAAAPGRAGLGRRRRRRRAPC